MSADLAVLVPVLGRPDRVAPLLDSLRAATPVDFTVWFLADPDDQDELDAVTAVASGSVHLAAPGGNYAAKINHGVRMTHEPLIFLGADDLDFHPGWFDKARAHLRAGAQVVGVNDLCSARVKAGQHATHFLMTRQYAELPTIDGRPGPLCEIYDHSCVDDELVATARHRAALAFATDSIVEHLHPDVRKAEWDDTYRRGRARIREDRNIFRSRERLWA